MPLLEVPRGGSLCVPSRPPWFKRLESSAATPLLLLALVSVLSLGARALLLDEPCQSPCNTRRGPHADLDEAYYVNAARVIAGIRPPAAAPIRRCPARHPTPNAEHPQGAQGLIMAGGESSCSETAPFA